MMLLAAAPAPAAPAPAPAPAAAAAADSEDGGDGDRERLCNERLKCGIRPSTQHGAAVCGSESLGFKLLETALKCFGLTSTGLML